GRQITNSAAVTFAAKTDAGSVTIVAVGIFDASTAGNLSDIIPLDGDDVVAVIFNDVTTDFIRSPAHGLVNDQKVRLESFPGSVTFPSEFSANTVYFVVSSAADEFKLSATQGGGAINYTTQGRALLMQQTDLTVAQNDQVNFAIGLLKVADD
ncbi:MAG: phage tail fiber protein, partial [Candidatus Rokuibacteriota bacterium]